MPSDDSNDINLLHEQVVQSKRNSAANFPKTPDKLPTDKNIFCNHCKGETKHVCKADYYREFVSETERFLGGFWSLVGYRLWMCAGCSSCTLELIPF